MSNARKNPRWAALPLIAVLFVTASGTPLRGQESGDKVYKSLLKSTVWVVSLKPASEGKTVLMSTGTGSVVDRTKHLILTNEHVVGKASEVLVIFPIVRKGKPVAEKSFYMKEILGQGLYTPGRVVDRDTKRDLALIQIPALPEGAAALKLADDSPDPGQRVHSVGNPGESGALWVYTSGTVRQVYQKKWMSESSSGPAVRREAQVVETQSPTNPGDSGGPLVNDRCELVGVTQGILQGGQLISLFVDVTEVRALLRQNRVGKIAPPPPKPAVKPPPVTAPSPPPAVAAGAPAEVELAKQEKQAATRLGLAKQLAADGLGEKARQRYREIVDQYPKTKAAGEARKLLDAKNR